MWFCLLNINSKSDDMKKSLKATVSRNYKCSKMGNKNVCKFA